MYLKLPNPSCWFIDSFDNVESGRLKDNNQFYVNFQCASSILYVGWIITMIKKTKSF